MIWFMLIMALLISYGVVFMKGVSYGVNEEYNRQYAMFNGNQVKK